MGLDRAKLTEDYNEAVMHLDKIRQRAEHYNHHNAVYGETPMPDAVGTLIDLMGHTADALTCLGRCMKALIEDTGATRL